eukprot:CAMPEP_0167757102 /NCGR_PEP_ID=MMETSP0110_2-20121227/9744_1 /TAXON_ID=629695 /ORGANISM="Gymnochlora sp., Strain CCMP2014" /LENGTH=212 /DNA_ID=CAMNT_0007643265 /DNA_START=13 /DNA_END=651 /DNA_ORIENTATION=-
MASSGLKYGTNMRARSLRHIKAYSCERRDIVRNGIFTAMLPFLNLNSNAATSYAERSGLSGQSNQDTAAYTQLSNGLKYLDVKPGSGPAVENGDTVIVESTGRLAGFNGQLFFKATGDGADPLEFKVGEGLAIPGLDLGVLGMKKGGVRRLIIPGDLGYPRPCTYSQLGGPGAFPDPGELRYRQLLFAVVNNDAREDTLVVDVKVDIIRKSQ